MNPKLERYLKWFEEFVDSHPAPTAADRENIRIKKEHSLRVLAEAEPIAASLGRDENLTFLFELSALLHDVGRFPQYAQYGMFDDSLSEDHGRLGAGTLNSSGVLEDLPLRDRRVVVGATLVHNKLAVPDRLDSRTALATRVVRDADKLDIFFVLMGYFRSGGLKNQVVTLGLRDESEAWSPLVLDWIRAGKVVRYTDMVYLNDFKILALSWVYDLNFPFSRTRLLSLGYLDEVLAGLPQTDDFQKLGLRLKSHLENGAG